jgi:hypothetical protein
MKKVLGFRVIGKQIEDTWVDGVEIDPKKLIIYLVRSFGLEEKAKTEGVELCITCDSAKLDEYCCHMTGGFKSTDKDSWNPLIIDENDIFKRGMSLFNKTQSNKKYCPSISVIAKDTTASYKHFLDALFVSPFAGYWNPGTGATTLHEEQPILHEKRWRC